METDMEVCFEAGMKACFEVGMEACFGKVGCFPLIDMDCRIIYADSETQEAKFHQH